MFGVLFQLASSMDQLGPRLYVFIVSSSPAAPRMDASLATTTSFMMAFSGLREPSRFGGICRSDSANGHPNSDPDIFAVLFGILFIIEQGFGKH